MKLLGIVLNKQQIVRAELESTENRNILQLSADAGRHPKVYQGKSKSFHKIMIST